MSETITSVSDRARTTLENIKGISVEFAEERSERQRRRELVKGDFDRLRDAGFLLTGVPADHDGIWESVESSTRIICEMLRYIAHGDSSVALVAAMHPAVIVSGGWPCIAEAPEPFRRAWEEQRKWVFQTARDGHWWGTIVSEPGSGGDQSKSKAPARHGSSEGEYLLSGQKHFGSGSGNSSFVITVAVPGGETAPDGFFMDMRGVPWDGSSGVKLIAPWDGHGMTATQSHALQFVDFPVTRRAWHNAGGEFQRAQGGSVRCMFAGVIVGIVETAIETARSQLKVKHDSMRAYERVEWARVEMEGWLIQQAYEGMLHAVETDVENRGRDTLFGKEAIAELAETVMQRISKVIGGAAYSRHLPYGFWQEDVRALGFLRPPWGFAFDTIFDGAWLASE